MIVVTYSCPADRSEQQPFVYGPFASREAANEWITRNRTGYQGHFNVTALIEPQWVP